MLYLYSRKIYEATSDQNSPGDFLLLLNSSCRLTSLQLLAVLCELLKYRACTTFWLVVCREVTEDYLKPPL